MSTITFDTFKYVERLERAGFVREQATAFVEAQRDALSEALDTALATKQDVTEVKATVLALDAKVEKVTWMLGAVLALAIANFAKQYF